MDIQSIYAGIVAELTKEPGVSFPAVVPGKRKPFGSNALHVNEKIFCMVDRLGRFVVKLPAEEVTALLKSGGGTPFEMGKARWAKEWVVLVPSTEATWPARAREALAFVRSISPVKSETPESDLMASLEKVNKAHGKTLKKLAH